MSNFGMTKKTVKHPDFHTNRKFILDLSTSSKNKTMRFTSIIQVMFIFLIIQGCVTQQLTNEGQSAYKEGNYEKALQAYDQVIEKYKKQGETAEAAVYYKAGMAAWKLDQSEKALKYLERAEYLEYPSPKLYLTLAEISDSIDNLSKKLEALENYHKKYAGGKRIDSINIRLFETYVESENWKKAVNLWPEIKKQAQSDVNLLTGYLTANNNLENQKVANRMAEKILKLEPTNKKALKWLGKKYFWKAEDTYVKEMSAYKNNRTTSQYDRLLEKLDEVYPTFEKARDYFLKLYKLEPKPKYAEFLGKIYKRLQEEDKAEYYFNKAE